MGLFSTIASVLGLGYNLFKDQHLTGAQQEANAFSAAEAEKNREFQHNEVQSQMQFQGQQTQAQMAFQERMANTQYQRAVADMQSAGLNPALAYANGGNVAPSGAAASGAAGSGSSASSVDPGRGLSMSDMLALAKIKSEVTLNEKQASLLEEQERSAAQNRLKTQIEADWLPKIYASELDINSAQLEKYSAEIASIVASTEGQKILNAWNPKLFESQLENDKINRASTIAGISKIQQEIKNLIAENENILQDTNVKLLTQGLIAAQTALASSQSAELSARTWREEYENQFTQLYGHKPDEPLWNSITSLLGVTGGNIRDVLRHPFKYFNKSAKSFLNDGRPMDPMD